MSNIIPFNYDGVHGVRVINENNNPLFVARDVCDILGLSDVSKTVSRLDDDEKGTKIIPTPGGNQEMLVVTESGLYSLVLTSNKPEAKEFKRWITHEVIPSIRKTGGYVGNDDLFIETYLPFADESTKTMFKGMLDAIRQNNELIKKQQKEIQYKEDVIIGLVDSVELAEKRQILNQVVRHKNANFQDRWKELYRQFEMKYHIDLNKRLIAYNEENKPKLGSKLDYIDKVMGKLPELYEIACKLYEGDIKEITEKLYKIA